MNSCCLMLDACCLMPGTCLLLAAWWVWQVFKHQAASSKHASGLKQHASRSMQAASIQNRALDWQGMKKHCCFRLFEFLLESCFSCEGVCIRLRIIYALAWQLGKIRLGVWEGLGLHFEWQFIAWLSPEGPHTRSIDFACGWWFPFSNHRTL